MLTISYVVGGYPADAETGVRGSEGTFVEFRFDVVTSTRHEFGADVTEFIVEGDAAMSDHKRARNRRMSIVGTVTNTPLGDLPATGAAGTSAKVVVDQNTGRVTYDREFDRVADALNELAELAENPVEVTVETRFFTIDSAQIVSVVAPRDEKSGDSVEFTIDVVVVNYAEAVDVGVPIARSPRSRRRARATQQQPEDESSQGSERAGSWARRIANGDALESVRNAIGNIGA